MFILMSIGIIVESGEKTASHNVRSTVKSGFVCKYMPA